jgi:hypothetical protein
LTNNLLSVFLRLPLDFPGVVGYNKVTNNKKENGYDGESEHRSFYREPTVGESRQKIVPDSAPKLHL